MPKVGIVMGSDSDLKVMSKAAKMLEKLGIDYEMTIISEMCIRDRYRACVSQYTSESVTVTSFAVQTFPFVSGSATSSKFPV